MGMVLYVRYLLTEEHYDLLDSLVRTGMEINWMLAITRRLGHRGKLPHGHIQYSEN